MGKVLFISLFIFACGVAVGLGVGYKTWHVEITAGTCVDTMSNSISTSFDNFINKVTKENGSN